MRLINPKFEGQCPLFRIGQKVLIEPINVKGKVIAYFYQSQMEYRVRYFDNGEVKEVYFYEDELKIDNVCNEII